MSESPPIDPGRRCRTIQTRCTTSRLPRSLRPRHPVTLPRKRVGRQADATRFRLAVEAAPVQFEPLGPEVQDLFQTPLLDPAVEDSTELVLGGQEREGLRVALRFPQ